jgi:hypothetical protein
MSDKSQQKRKKPGPIPRHGGYSLLTTGRLPERRKYIAPYLTAVREGLIHDLAKSEEELSTAQRILIDRVVTFLGVVRLMEEHAKEKGIFSNSQGRLNPALGVHYLAFNRNIKEILALLGIERRQVDSEPTLAEIIREHDEAEAKRAQGATSVGVNEDKSPEPIAEGGDPALSDVSISAGPGGGGVKGKENE